MLAAFVLTLHDDAGRQMGQTDRTVGFVDVLPARAAGSERILPHVIFVDVDLDAVGHLGGHIDRREAGLSLPFGVERADADQSVHAGFTLQIAVRQRAAHGNRRVVDPGLVVVAAVQQFHRIVVLLGPLRVHPQQHLGPVIGVGSSVTGMDREDRATGVVGAVEQVLQLELLDFALETCDFLRQLRHK